MAYPPIKGETRIVNVDLEKCLSEAEREQQLSNRMQRLDDEREQSTYTEQSRQQQYKEFGFQNGNEKENGRETIMCDSDDESSKNRMEKRRNRRELQFTIQGLRPGTRHSKVVARHYISIHFILCQATACQLVLLLFVEVVILISWMFSFPQGVHMGCWKYGSRW